MITKIEGHLSEIRDQSVVLNLQGLFYEVFVIKSVKDRFTPETLGQKVSLTIFHYVQTDPSKSIPMLLGFNNEVEREFFERFITVSGIGPRAAMRALNVPISKIAQAIDGMDVVFLKTLPGVGEQRAREIIAKLQGRIGRFGLLQDQTEAKGTKKSDIEEEALAVLLQLQYKKEEAKQMIARALSQNKKIKTIEELLNVVYSQRKEPAHAA